MIMVVKLGGNALSASSDTAGVLTSLAQDISQLTLAGTDVVVVHGGGPQISELLDALAVPSIFREGLRVTDAATMRCVAMGLGYVNSLMTATLCAAGLACVGIDGSSDHTFIATSLGADWANTGSAPVVNPRVIMGLLKMGLVPVVSPVATNGDGELMNCNADAVAGALAAALGADVLVLLSDVDQLRSDPDDSRSALSSVTRSEVRKLMASGAVREGMTPKMQAALAAVDAGAQRVLVGNGSRPHALSAILSKTVPSTEVLS